MSLFSAFGNRGGHNQPAGAIPRASIAAWATGDEHDDRHRRHGGTVGVQPDGEQIGSEPGRGHDDVPGKRQKRRPRGWPPAGARRGGS